MSREKGRLWNGPVHRLRTGIRARVQRYEGPVHASPRGFRRTHVGFWPGFLWAGRIQMLVNQMTRRPPGI
ncbi:uncharacterized protein LAESUDRAFT_727434 [Laetiporus sulphureus 93-53]|uniref:Uncharacterized protein n=1 Tax=Laetiporus sulphureus 93-53 TaxID=1314785 RepID=A0A165DH19_9APHY|nr:uncharacterized protein LAESUDRAFT_727434 [Laetiporus sulphureus 93-53]KZT04861.1 hypothetical protein LAESUDRAFT_727434 [Laetiporus sulphureus 93-53]